MRWKNIFFEKYNDTYDCDCHIFALDDLDNMKMREKLTMKMMVRGYYRSKSNYEEFYWKIMGEYSSFINCKMLLQLISGWITEKNEVMTTSVAALAPKIIHYCTIINVHVNAILPLTNKPNHRLEPLLFSTQPFSSFFLILSPKCRVST